MTHPPGILLLLLEILLSIPPCDLEVKKHLGFFLPRLIPLVCFEVVGASLCISKGSPAEMPTTKSYS